MIDPMLLKNIWSVIKRFSISTATLTSEQNCDIAVQTATSWELSLSRKPWALIWDSFMLIILRHDKVAFGVDAKFQGMLFCVKKMGFELVWIANARSHLSYASASASVYHHEKR